MKRNSLIDYLLYITVRIFSFFLMCLPVSLAIWIGKILGRLSYHFDKKHRAIAYANLKVAFAKSKSPKQLRQITKKVFENFGQNLVELLILPKVNKKYIEKYITHEGKHLIDEALAKKRGLILLGVHFGSWELSNTACGLWGYPYNVLVREQSRYPKLDNLLNSYRQAKATKIIHRADDLRELIKTLKDNNIVGMVADQGGKTGTQIKFFNKEASLATGAIRLAMKFDIPLLAGFIVRERGPYHRIIIKPIEFERKGDSNNLVLINLEKMIRLSEELIAKYPEQYLWFYRVWKYSSIRRLIILSDGKAGHLRQSEAVLKTMQSEFSKRNLSLEPHIIKIKFKNQFSKAMLTIGCLFTDRYSCQGCLWCLRRCLKEESYRELLKSDTDVVISCGSSLAALNFVISRENLAKSIHIMRPGILSVKRFDALIMPEHDKPVKRENVFVVDSALNLIDKTYLDEQAKILIRRYPHLDESRKLRLGVFIGGDTKRYALPISILDEFIDKIKDLSEELNAQILLTTSRRTPKQAELILKEKLGSFPNCKLLVIANEANIPEAVGGILGLSEIILVSSDSIAMISEAASANRYVIVVDLVDKQKSSVSQKHKRFLEGFKKKGYIRITGVSDVQDTAKEIWQNKPPIKVLNNNRIIEKALRRI